MPDIGSLGDVAFFVRSNNGKNEMLSFHDLVLTSSAAFGEHERNRGKSYLEFTNPGLDELSFIVEANARYGIRPLDVQKKLYDYEENGTSNVLVIGGRKIGKNPFVITGMSDTYKSFYIDGRPIALSFQITLREYANQAAQVTTIPPARQIGTSASITAASTSYDTYVVVKGDCLWNIAIMFYGSGSQYVRIFNANKDIIKDASLIYPGQILKIPK